MGQVLPENKGMLSLARKVGFESHFDSEAGNIEIRLPLA
jgi:hypothetical protein